VEPPAGPDRGRAATGIFAAILCITAFPQKTAREAH